MPKAKKRMENSNALEPIKLIPKPNFGLIARMFPIKIPNNKPKIMLFRKLKK